MKQNEIVMRNITRLLTEKYSLLASASAVACDIERIFKGEPFDYVIGWAQFLNCHIDLSLRPFIPRPETEYWTKELVGILRNRKTRQTLRVLDMFSGSGCVGIAISKHILHSHVTFVERNPRFVKQIKINLKKNGVSEGRFRIIQSDLFKKISGMFDVITANPPYVGRRDFLDKGVKKWEPRVAYDGGPDGLLITQRFLKTAKKYLRQSGEIWMEFGSGQKQKIHSLLRQNDYRNFSFHLDQYGKPRYVVIGS